MDGKFLFKFSILKCPGKLKKAVQAKWIIQHKILVPAFGKINPFADFKTALDTLFLFACFQKFFFPIPGENFLAQKNMANFRFAEVKGLVFY